MQFGHSLSFITNSASFLFFPGGLFESFKQNGQLSLGINSLNKTSYKHGAIYGAVQTGQTQHMRSKSLTKSIRNHEKPVIVIHRKHEKWTI